MVNNVSILFKYDQKTLPDSKVNNEKQCGLLPQPNFNVLVTSENNKKKIQNEVIRFDKLASP